MCDIIVAVSKSCPTFMLKRSKKEMNVSLTRNGNTCHSSFLYNLDTVTTIYTKMFFDILLDTWSALSNTSCHSTLTIPILTDLILVLT